MSRFSQLVKEVCNGQSTNENSQSSNSLHNSLHLISQQIDDESIPEQMKRGFGDQQAYHSLLLDQYQSQQQQAHFLNVELKMIDQDELQNSKSQNHFLFQPDNYYDNSYIQNKEETEQFGPFEEDNQEESNQIQSDHHSNIQGDIQLQEGIKQLNSINWKEVLTEQNFYNIFKKNVNMPKAVGRYLFTYHQQYRHSIYSKHQSYFHSLAKELKEIQNWVKKSKKNSFKLQHLLLFFNHSEKSEEECQLARLMMRKILIRHSRKEILPNNQVKDKKEYLVASKIFALRCSNPKLATRMQMR